MNDSEPLAIQEAVDALRAGKPRGEVLNNLYARAHHEGVLACAEALQPKRVGV